MSEIRVKSTGTIKLFESDNTSSVTIASPASLGGDRTITIPDADVNLTNIATNTAKTSNATHSGEVTGATALTIADNIVDEANLKVSNAPTNGYALTAQSGNTGGMTWASVGGDNTPYFRADTTTQTVGGGATLIFTNSVFDSASGYNTSTGKYTIPSGQGGYWWFQANATIGVSYTGMFFNIQVGGTNRLRGVTGNASLGTTHCSGILNVSAANEITVALELGSSQALAGTAYLNSFSGYKLIT